MARPPTAVPSAPPVAMATRPTPPPATTQPHLGWLVRIEGREAPLFILAADISAAAARAAQEVGVELLGRASIHLIGPDISLR